jgi:retron-type reverse transcriptase
MEHIVTKHVMNHLENNKIIYELQHGFRHNRSCETQLRPFIQELSETDNKNIQTDLIIMDFAKAFDKVPHHRLLYKLNYYGISGPTLHRISAFLTNRTQTVVIDGKTSSTVPVTSGVPQGTVMGPVLFLVYINDLSDYLTHSHLSLFADDSIIYMQIKSQHDCDKLQQDLDAAARWKS